MRQHPLDRGGAEQVGVVFHPRRQAGGVFDQVKRQIELCRPAVELQLSELQSRPIHRFERRPLQRKHHLKQRRVAQAPFLLQCFDDSIKRHLLVGIGINGHFAHASEELAERRIAGQVTAQQQGVDEKPDEPFGFRQIAAGHGRTHQNVLLCGVAMEQCLKRGEQCHEQRDALALA